MHLRRALRSVAVLSLTFATVGACSKDSDTTGGDGDGDGDSKQPGDGDSAPGDGDGDLPGDGDGDLPGDGDGDLPGDGDAAGGQGGEGGADPGPQCEGDGFGGMGGISSVCAAACESECPANSDCSWGGSSLSCSCHDGFEGDDCHACEQIVLSDDFATGALGTAGPDDINGGFNLQYSCPAVATEPPGTNASVNTTESTACTGGIFSKNTVSSTSLSRRLTARFEVTSAPALDEITMLRFGFQQRDGYSVGGGAGRPHIFLSMYEKGPNIALQLTASSQAGADSKFLSELFPATLEQVSDGFVVEFDISPDNTWEVRVTGVSDDVIVRSGLLETHTFSELFNGNSFGDVIRPAAYIEGLASVDTVQSLLIDRISVFTHECGL